MQLNPQVNEFYRHKKRGTCYLILGLATMQCELGTMDMLTVVVYQDSTGKQWVRPFEEFTSERFEKV